MSQKKSKLDQEALAFHANGRPGKLEITATKPLMSQHDLSLAYSPGVAAPCLAIEADPDTAYDYTAKGNVIAVISNGTAVLGLGGTVHTNKRDIAADDFFTGMFETALDEDEMITAVSFPKVAKAAYLKFPNPASRYAMVGVFVAAGGDGTRVAVTGAGSDGVFRHGGMESALDGDFSASALDGVAVDSSDLIGDIHAAPDYRAHLVREMAKRAVDAC
jgi:hypothetical protein